MDWTAVILIGGVVPVFFILFWCAVSLLLSLTGWRSLSRAFATDIAPHGHPFWGLTGSVGLASYRGLTAWVAPEGLFLTMPFAFRLGHPPLLIPWSEIRDMKIRRSLTGQAATFLAGNPPTAVTLPVRVLQGRMPPE